MLQIKKQVHKNRLNSVSLFSLSGSIIGVISIVLSIVLVYFDNWKQTSYSQLCEPMWEFNYLNKIKIVQIIYIVMLSICTMCFFIIFLYSTLQIKFIQQDMSIAFGRVLFILLWSIALLTAIVSLLYAIKTYSAAMNIVNQNSKKVISDICINSVQMTKLTNKKNPCIMIISLIGLMILFLFIIFFYLPYEYLVCNSVQQVYQQKKQIKRVLQQDISRQQLLVEEPIIINKTYRNIGVGDELARVEVKPPILKKQIGVNSVTKQFFSIGIGNHIKFTNKATDCEGLVQQIFEQDKTQQQFEEPVQQQIVYEINEQEVTPKAVKRSTCQRTETKKVNPSLLTPRKKNQKKQEVENSSISKKDRGYYYLSFEEESSLNSNTPRDHFKLGSARKLLQGDKVSSSQLSNKSQNYAFQNQQYYKSIFKSKHPNKFQ